jgi:hypothetical protein
VAVAAAITPINISSELCSIGTLFAYSARSSALHKAQKAADPRFNSPGI